MGLQTSAVQTQLGHLGPQEVAIRCKLARELEEAGEFTAAQDALGDVWQGVGERPMVNDLPDDIKAELLLRAGTLTGWLGSASQTGGTQELAKDLISESAALFASLGSVEKVAEAHVNLANCYWREGAVDEARVTLRLVLDALTDADSEQRLRALINSAMIDHVAMRHDEALRILRESAPMVDRSSNHGLKGKFHNEFGILFKSLALSTDREEYIDQALLEFAAAQFHFEQAGHGRFQARVANNEGFLFARLGRFEEAHQHLDKARGLHLSIGDLGSAAGVDDTRAQAFLMEGRNEVAERTARAAVRVLERGDERSIFAEALTTHGTALARLNQREASKRAFDRAIEVAQIAGDPDSAGLAALTIIEELGEQLPIELLRDYYLSAERSLASSQHRKIQMRLGDTARRLLVSTFEVKHSDEFNGAGTPEMFVENPSGEAYSLEAEVHRYEANLIRRALEASGGSVTRAARMLGVTHQGLAFILNGRHKDLLSIRTPVKKRRRSIIRYH